MREAMTRINAERGNEDLLLKIGIHEGPCLAVTLNNSQDYFGQTVNMAARVQGLASSRAIFVTQPVVDDQKTANILAKSGLQSDDAARGVARHRRRDDGLRDSVIDASTARLLGRYPDPSMPLREEGVSLKKPWRGSMPSAIMGRPIIRGGPPWTPSRQNPSTIPLDTHSHVVRPAAMEWKKTRFAGCEVKGLLLDKETGLVTALMRFAPGATLPDHEHVKIEQTYVLEGRLVDKEGPAEGLSVGPGEFVWREAGSRHVAWTPEGGLMLAMFQVPNKFFESDGRVTDISGTDWDALWGHVFKD